MSIGTQHEQTGIKIIVAFEDEYNAYQGTLAATIKILRPDGVVVTADPKEISRVATRFDPDIIIGSGFNDEDLDAVGAWIDLSLDPTQATRVQVGGEYSEMINPTLDKLLEIIEEVAQLTQTSDL